MTLLYLRVKIFKQRIIEKFTNADFKTITNLLDRNNSRILAFGIQHTVNRGGRNAALIGKGVDCDISLQA
jgi:hypothetical protein